MKHHLTIGKKGTFLLLISHNHLDWKDDSQSRLRKINNNNNSSTLLDILKITFLMQDSMKLRTMKY